MDAVYFYRKEIDSPEYKLEHYLPDLFKNVFNYPPPPAELPDQTLVVHSTKFFQYEYQPENPEFITNSDLQTKAKAADKTYRRFDGMITNNSDPRLLAGETLFDIHGSYLERILTTGQFVIILFSFLFLFAEVFVSRLANSELTKDDVDEVRHDLRPGN